VPWLAAVALLSTGWIGTHYIVVAPAENRLIRLEGEWMGARQSLAHRQDAYKARQDLARVLAALPVQRDFARLPLAISEMAKRDHVTLPSLSYSLEKSGEGLPIKAVLQGPVTGRYEDLRSFLYHLEAADQLLLFIEDLSVSRSSVLQKDTVGRMVTVNLRIATYVREKPQRGRALRASVE